MFVHAPPAGHDFECTHDFGWELLINGGLPPPQTFSRWLEWLRNHHLITKDARFKVSEWEGAMQTLGELKVKICLLVERSHSGQGPPNHVPYGR